MSDFPRVSVGAHLPGMHLMKPATDHALQCEREAMRIAAVLYDADRIKRAFEEAERRAEVFEQARLHSEVSVEPPRLAALRSVARDAAAGWFG